MAPRGGPRYPMRVSDIVALIAALQFVCASWASAQESRQATQAAQLDEVTVTGSRIISTGLEAPTPLTVVSGDELKDGAPGNFAIAVSQLPQFAASINASTAWSTPGPSYLNLRAIGSQRTLVLLDGRRLVASGHGSRFTGSSDIGLIPHSLVRHVDIVTGGASAAYGSDAVSGVANFVLDTTYQGFKGDLQGGISDRGDKENYKASLTGGMGFAGGRGHIIAFAEHSRDDGLLYAARSWAADSWAVINNPNVTAANPKSPTNPQRILRRDVRNATVSYGGLITSGPLAGTQFGPGGVPQPFQYGTDRSGATMSGGDGPDGSMDGYLDTAQDRWNAFTHVSYDISDRLTAFAEALIGRSHTNIIPWAGWQVPPQTFTIFSGNPYIPASIQQQMTALNLASFQMGRLSRDFALTEEDAWERATRFVGGLKGTFREGWSFEVYYTHSRSKHRLDTAHDVILRNLYRASDAVLDPATGNLVCKSKLDNPTSTNPEIADCVPINVFGEGSPSAEAASYVTGTEIDNNLHKQDVAAFSVNGNLFSTWAGPASIAFGGEYRKESANGPADPIAGTIVTNTDIINGVPVVIRSMPPSLIGKAGGWILTNTFGIEGEFNVTEGFLETLVPLASDVAWAESLDLNAAMRYADYNLSGGVTTWKAGLVYQPISGLRFRGTRSRDIRSGNINELFSGGRGTGLTVSDPFRNGAVSSGGNTNTIGNPNLEPEEADTSALGLTYQPSWFPGFSASVDWYNIDIKGAITSLGAQNIVDQCFQGATHLCSLIRRNEEGIIDFVTNPTLNASSLKASGWDIEASYRAPVSSNGNLTLRLLGSYAGKLETSLPGARPIDRAGDIRNGTPHWRASLTAKYDKGPLSLFLQERYIGSGLYDSTFVDRIDIDNNHIPARFYTDVTGRYRFGASENTEVFFTVNNLLDQEPPHSGMWSIVVGRPLQRALYDSVGRAYTAGVTFAF